MDTCGKIRVHNTGAFVISVTYDSSPQGITPLWSPTFPVGQSADVGTGMITPRDGAQIWPVVNVEAGSQGHAAGQNVIYNQRSRMVAVYNCGGTTFMPSFSYQGLSSDW